MTRLLPSVLSRLDLPEAELHAARLDGELFAVDECFAPVDEIAESHGRGRALAMLLPPRLIAEQRTAAWVLGAQHDAPVQHELCADSAARYRCLGLPRLTVREVVLDDGDTLLRGGIRVTTPLRTAIDLARISEDFGEAEKAIVVRLSTIGGFVLADALAYLDRRRGLPRKVRAAERLTGALNP